MGKMIAYAKTKAFTVWRDTRTHNGYVEDNATGERSLWFVCIEGAEALARARRMRQSSPGLFDDWCRATIARDNPENH